MLEFEQQVMSCFGVVEFQNQNVTSLRAFVVCIWIKCHTGRAKKVGFLAFFGMEIDIYTVPLIIRTPPHPNINTM